MPDDKKPFEDKFPDIKVEVIGSDSETARKLDDGIKWMVKEYTGVEVLRVTEGRDPSNPPAGTWSEDDLEPITVKDDLVPGMKVILPTLTGDLALYTAEVSEDGKLLLRNGDFLGVPEWAPDDRNCWVCVGTANIKAIQKLQLEREAKPKTEREKLEAAIRNAHRVAQSRMGKEGYEEAADVARWLDQLHAMKYPLEDEEEDVVNLDDHRVRTEREFEDDQMLYVEILWGMETFAYNVAIRDIEKMRRGTEEPSKPLRPPETDYEIELIVKHIRWFANEVARMSGNVDWVRPEDDTAAGK